MKNCRFRKVENRCSLIAENGPACSLESCPKQRIGNDSKVYISGPMSNFENFNREAFYLMEKILRKHFDVGDFINPANVDPKLSWEEAMAIDLEAIKSGGVTHLVLLNGWNRSLGAKLEVALAIDRKLNIITEDEIYKLFN